MKETTFNESVENAIDKLKVFKRKVINTQEFIERVFQIDASIISWKVDVNISVVFEYSNDLNNEEQNIIERIFSDCSIDLGKRFITIPYHSLI